MDATHRTLTWMVLKQHPRVVMVPLLVNGVEAGALLVRMVLSAPPPPPLSKRVRVMAPLLVTGEVRVVTELLT